jgi:NAD(P)H-dependent flavin oxidoreductase YrpB (nitropropane dioxygenase family)
VASVLGIVAEQSGGQPVLPTRACQLLGITHPIVQAGMARYGTAAELVAAVSASGGLGTLGCLGRSADETEAQLRRIRALTSRPFAVNFVLHRCDEAAFAACLAQQVPIFTFFRGDPETPIARVHEAGALAMVQVTTVEEARRACAVGADLLIAQGTEAGGHMGPVPLWSLLPDVVATAAGRPVLAAGGIVDGRGLAAALCLGAAGIVIGTRFLATPEAPVPMAHKQAIVQAPPDATVASGIFDLIWGEEWPGVQARALRNQFTARWVNREAELRAQRAEAFAALQQAEAAADMEEMINLAGMGAGRIHDLVPAGQLVQEVVAEAERILREWSERLASASR